MAAKPLPSAAVLRAMFRYDRRSGRLSWRARADVPPAWNARHAGQPAGTITGYGVAIAVKGCKIVLAHRIIWKMAHDSEPDEIDHIDGDPLNNRLDNLRAATRMQNMRNVRRRPGASGRLGVFASGRRWAAKISVAGRLHRLGTFDTPDQAEAAYRAARRQHFGAFAPER